MAVTTLAKKILKDAAVNHGEAVPEAFWMLIEQYRGMLANQALSIVRNMPDAEDVVQETFCDLFQIRDEMDQIKSLGAWLRKTNQRRAFDKLQESKRLSNKAKRVREAVPQDPVTGGFRQVEIRETVAQAIEDLKPKFREAMILRYWEHKSCDQIAERMKLPAGTARWLVYEASTQLHKKLSIMMSTGNQP